MASREPVDEPTQIRSRDAAADAREAAADRREREEDIREGILDRWERELAAQALALHMFDEDDQTARDDARRRRSAARARRRADAELRADLAIERAVDRATDGLRPAGPASAGVLDPAAHRVLEQLGVLVEQDGTLAETLGAVLGLALDAVPDAAAVTICLPVDGALQPAASTAGWAGDLDSRQVGHGRGPIADAVSGRTIVTTDDLGADPRWRLGDVVGPDGHRAAISTSIDVNGTIGALSLYTAPGGRFDERAALTAASIAAQSTLALAWSMERLSHRAQSEAWERALESRDQIGQAKGILMEQRNLSAEAAFELLRTTSQRLNTKVREIAEHVVAHRTLPDDSSASA